MPTLATKDGVEIFYKDWGKGQPIVFSHGWPLSADDWDAQMLFFLKHGYRVIAHDRRGHGRSTQVGDGHDMDHYADDLAALTAHLDLNNAIHVGHSTGGGEVAHYLARHGESRVAKAALISAVPPLMVKTDANPNGLPKKVFDDFQSALAANRSSFYRDVAAGPFYGYNRPGVKSSEAVIENWWRQGMMGGAKAHYDGIGRLFANRLLRRPQEDHHTGDGDAQRRRSDRALRRLRANVSETAEERDAEDLQRIPAWHAHHGSRDNQRQPAGLSEGVTAGAAARRATRSSPRPRSPWARSWSTRPSPSIVSSGIGARSALRRGSMLDPDRIIHFVECSARCEPS
jgi:non-heme chloroperoxidase